MAYEVKPTRSELIATKRKIVLSKSGHKLLKMKRDGLIMEFFKILPLVKDMRGQLSELYIAAMRKLALAEAAEGKLQLRSTALTQKLVPTLDLSSRNLMGVIVPAIEAQAVRKDIRERGYGLIGTSVRTDEAVEAFEHLVEEIMAAAELENTMKKLLDEIESTKRRVNALEFVVIPQLEEAANYITLRLEEMERENVFRLKRIKGKG